MAALRRSQRRIKPVERFGSVVGSHELTEKYIRDSASSKIKQDKTFYDIEIKEINPISRKAKVHYVGYSEKYDEWKDLDYDGNSEFPIIKYDKLVLPSKETLQERLTVFCSKLSLEIKKKLLSYRNNNPEVRFEIPIDRDVYEASFCNVGMYYSFRSKTGRLVPKNEEMDHLLGYKWSIRVKNKYGDCEYVTEGTFCFWMEQRPPLDDFVQVGDEFLPRKFEQEPFLVVRFVRGTGNSRTYRQLFNI